MTKLFAQNLLPSDMEIQREIGVLTINENQIVKSSNVIASAEFHIRKLELINAERSIFEAYSELYSLNAERLTEANAPIEVRVGGRTEMSAYDVQKNVETFICDSKQQSSFWVSYNPPIPDTTLMQLDIRADLSEITSQIKHLYSVQPFYISLLVRYKNPPPVFEIKSENSDEWTNHFEGRPIIFTNDFMNPWINGYDENDYRGWEEWYLPEYSPFLDAENEHELRLVKTDNFSLD